MNGAAPRRRTVSEIAGPYANYLVRVPSTGDDVCPVCHSTVTGYPTCFKCGEAKRLLGTLAADVTAFVSMAPRGEQLARELITYKDPRVGAHDRRRMTTGLAAVLWKWLGIHEACLARLVGGQRFDLLTTVPSTSGRELHPLPRLVGGLVAGSAERHTDVLAVARTDLDPRTAAADRFRTTRPVDGQHVLVIDDTWTTGAHAQSASAALKSAGATAVGILSIGRWFNPSFDDGARWLATHRRPGWDWSRCCVHLEPRDHGGPALTWTGR